ncbi:TonB-linked outer membrane protein, SusC/RagA family [Chitinophaga rupis]|uniref:TonB-linked outer membrane protein, SusC/RagA family n=1 Tax=Chitinophaga rupis TaxID=573321 RepID=A0A1H8E031_9BACT|nr:SusC/RagA family TonB-linked outer membrane protein [Chitinophaga rupis]SEN12813.1 TonB-linked outer membrane protein, SusC/RagA family [Chitinophaga rupis]
MKKTRCKRYGLVSLLWAFFTLTFTITYAQTSVVAGKVVDSAGAPVAGASIIIKGVPNRGTHSNSDGSFKINASGNEVLEVRYLGFESQDVPANAARVSRITLKLTNANLNDVVVVGYGTQKKATLTGAIAQVGAEVFKDRPVANAAVALQGAVPGLSITRTSSRPGNEGLAIRLRGESSVTGVDPLIIVDGVPVIGTWELNQINPYDIETVTVLKDASAAIYGARAQGGVMLVTTKRGKSGKMQVSVNSNVSVNTVGINVPWANMPQWAGLYLATATADKRDANGNPVEWYPQWTKDNLQRMANNESFDYTDPNGIIHHYADNNWQNALYGPAWSTQQNVSLRGGSDKSRYMLSLGYANSKSLLKTAYDGEKKYTLRLNYDYNISKAVKLETQVAYDDRLVQSPRNGIGNGYFDAPVFPVYNATGQYYDDYGYRNPVAFTKSGGTTKNTEGILRLNGKLTAEIIDGLRLSGTAAIVKRNGWQEAYNQTFSLYNWVGDKVNSVQYAPPNNPSVTNTVGNTLYQNYGVQLDYTKTIGADHNLAFMVANTAELSETRGLSASRSQLQFDGLYDINTAISPASAAYNQLNGGGASHWGLISYIGRANYDFRKKYLLEVLGRRDGSSRFQAGYRWANFYSVSGGWRITEETFMKKLRWLNDLKVRGSYGETGGQANIGLYDYIATVNVNGTALFGATPGLQSTAYLAGITTNQRTWERMVNKNIGLDFSVLNNRLSGSFDLFEKQNVGMLIALVYPTLLGGNAPTTNNGTFRTRGWELALRWDGSAANGKVRYNLGFNLSDNKTMVTSYAGKDTWVAGKNAIRQGYPLNALFLYKTDGYFKTQEEVAAYMAKYGASGDAAGYTGVTNTFHPGDLKRVDLDGDGKITTTGTGVKGSGDVSYYGDANPHYTFGFNLGAQWNGFDFGAFIQGVAKWNILRTGNARAPFFRNYLDVNTTYIGKTWSAENTDAEFPRLSFDSNINNWNWQNNDVNVQNLRYARLKSLVIGYTIPASLTSVIKMEKARLYFSGNDLFEITSVKDGFDPERGESSDNSYPFFRTWSFGLDITF